MEICQFDSVYWRVNNFGGSGELVEGVSYIYLVLRSEVWWITYCKCSPPGR